MLSLLALYRESEQGRSHIERGRNIQYVLPEADLPGRGQHVRELAGRRLMGRLQVRRPNFEWAARPSCDYYKPMFRRAYVTVPTIHCIIVDHVHRDSSYPHLDGKRATPLAERCDASPLSSYELASAPHQSELLVYYRNTMSS